ncbi:MAG: dethiobiotin synthase [Chromatiaceae bacterium]|nr:dethiobiotin synthase [Candidatus Thioaporhodococcus sediminis]
MKGFFVTGTDTGCGKTEVSLGLIEALRQRGLKVQAMKPVASGCVPAAPLVGLPLVESQGPSVGSEVSQAQDLQLTAKGISLGSSAGLALSGVQSPGLGPSLCGNPESTAGRGLRNADAERLLAQASRPAPYDWVNPYAFLPPIAPHIAARELGVRIDPGLIHARARALAGMGEVLIVEGVGGWRVPLGPDLALSDLPGLLGLPVILVVGLRLGCLNHALLTAESILAGGCRLAGWVANEIDPEMARREENLATLASLLPAPLLGHIPWLEEAGPSAASFLDVEGLMGACR